MITAVMGTTENITAVMTTDSRETCINDIIIIINGLILPLYPVLCCFKRDFYSVSSGSQDNSMLLSLLHFFFVHYLVLHYLEFYIT